MTFQVLIPALCKNQAHYTHIINLYHHPHLHQNLELDSKSTQAPNSLFGASLKLFACNPLSTSSPSLVRSGFPMGVTAPVKNRGCHSADLALRSAAFARCFSSISCLSVVARLYCLLRMASVTFSQNLRDSLGSCSSIGGTTLGTGKSGLRSMRRCFSCSNH